MALKKRTYTSKKTPITAENLNDIQDAIIALEGKLPEKVSYSEAQTLTDKQKAQARANIGAATVADVLTAMPTWKGGSY